MSETKGYRVWYRHLYDSSEWIQVVVINAQEAGVLAIDANGEVIVTSNILIHHDQNRSLFGTLETMFHYLNTLSVQKNISMHVKIKMIYHQ